MSKLNPEEQALPTEEQNSNTAYQRTIQEFLDNTITLHTPSETLSFAALLKEKGYNDDLSYITIDLSNIKEKKFDFSGMDLTNTRIVCTRIEDLNFGENSKNMATLLRTKIITSDQKEHTLDTNGQEIMHLVIDKPFDQGVLIKNNPTMLNKRGACVGLVVEKARWNLKHWEALPAQQDITAKDREYFIEKLNRKIANPAVAQNFTFRTQYYQNQIFGALGKRINASTNPLDHLPTDIDQSKIIGISFKSGKNDGHIISATKIAKSDGNTKYEIFDPNFGISTFDTTEAANKQINALIYQYQKSIHTKSSTTVKLHDLEKYVIDQGLLSEPENNLTKEQNKKRKYNIKDGDRSEDLASWVRTKSENFDYMKKLIREGADVNTPNSTLTPLTSAITEGRDTLVKELLAQPGIDVNIIDYNSDTALTLAIDNGYTYLTKTLLARPDININIKNGNGYTPLTLAVSKRDSRLVSALISKPDVNLNIQTSDGSTALTLALKKGYTNIAKLILDKNADVNIKDRDGNTAFALALDGGHTDIAKLILNKGADVDIKDRNGKTAFSLALDEGYTDIAKIILDKGADIEAKDKYGRTALLCALQNNNIEISKILLKKGANIEAQDNDGNNALIYAQISAIGYNNYELSELIENEPSNRAKAAAERAKAQAALEEYEMERQLMKQIFQEARAKAQADDEEHNKQSKIFKQAKEIGSNVRSAIVNTETPPPPPIVAPRKITDKSKEGEGR